jgi:hypothetical protein
MTKLDQALAACREDRNMQPVYYDLFLNSLFFVPTIAERGSKQQEGAMPLLVEAEGKSFLMLFDTIKRLNEWAEDAAQYVALPGHAVTAMSLPHLHWALNYGTEHQKQFEPDEIEWLKDVVRQAKADEIVPEQKA